MDIYVISQADPARMHTPQLLDAAGVAFTLVVDNAAQAKAARAMGYSRIESTGTTDIVTKRNAITRMAAGQWYVGLDDNIQDFTMVPAKVRGIYLDLPVDDHTNWRPRFNVPCRPQAFIDSLHNLQRECVAHGAIYGGVSTTENPFFRGKHYGYRRFVKSKVFVMDSAWHAKLKFKHRLCHDSYASALAVALVGKVVVDNWMFYKAKWYEKGGLGSREARVSAGLPEQLNECVAEFPGLIGLARGKNSALRFLKTSDVSVERWRKEHGWA